MLNQTKRTIKSSGVPARRARRQPRRYASPALGMTLIELLVVIIILVTLVGGVLPLLSPNNDANKIQSATRSLQSYLQKAQTKAMRTGRSVGVMFRESQPGSGVALEAYQIEVPPTFTGFSSSSTARFKPETRTKMIDGKMTEVISHYSIEFREGFGSGSLPPPNGIYLIPPRMVRVGDRITLGNSVFRLEYEDEQKEIDVALREETDEYFFRATNQFVHAELVSGPSPPSAPIDLSVTSLTGEPVGMSFPDSFAIARQPVVNSEPPLTLPKGVAVDMSGSGMLGGTQAMLFAGDTESTDELKQIGLMFSPTGGIEDVHLNARPMMPSDGELLPDSIRSQPITNVSQVLLLLATVEKSGLDLMGKAKTDDPWNMGNAEGDDQIQQSREKVSWLNPDSRWVGISGRSGLIQVAQNTLVDPRNYELPKRPVTKYEAYYQIDLSRGDFSLFNRLAANQQ